MGIQSCEGYYDSVFGKIQVKWSVSGDMLSYEVTIPANGEADLLLPDGEKRKN